MKRVEHVGRAVDELGPVAGERRRLEAAAQLFGFLVEAADADVRMELPRIARTRRRERRARSGRIGCQIVIDAARVARAAAAQAGSESDDRQGRQREQRDATGAATWMGPESCRPNAVATVWRERTAARFRVRRPNEQPQYRRQQ